MHWTHTRVRYGETDQMGVVYHGNYLAYFELGRTEYIRELGFPYAEFEAQGVRLPVIAAELRFLSAGRYDDELMIGTRLTALTSVRVTFESIVKLRDDARVIAEGATTLACVDGDGRPQRFPAAIREQLKGALEPSE